MHAKQKLKQMTKLASGLAAGLAQIPSDISPNIGTDSLPSPGTESQPPAFYLACTPGLVWLHESVPFQVKSDAYLEDIEMYHE
jgi:hypothetical protein